MRGRAAALGVRLRPHVKTHKCVELARIQVGADSGPVTVSTFAEARHFAAAGFRDQVLAVSLAPRRIPDALELAAELDAFAVLLDDAVVARMLSRVASAMGQVLDVYLEVDCGYGRTGVDPAAPEASELARFLHEAGGVRLRGLLTHGGHSYDCTDRAGILEVARQERDAVVGLAERLRALGISVPEVSVGSTPTMSVAEELPGGLAGVTEIRPGNYVFYDVFQAAIGACGLDRVGLSVLGTVIGRYPGAGRVVADTGSLALSADPGPVHLDGHETFGVALAVPEGEGRPGLALRSLSQEHGRLYADGPLRAGDFEVGSRLRLLPNHSCLTAAMHPVLYAVRGEEVVAEWVPCRGW